MVQGTRWPLTARYFSTVLVHLIVKFRILGWSSALDNVFVLAQIFSVVVTSLLCIVIAIEACIED